MSQNIVNIDCATLKDWLDKDEAILIDVREPSEYAQGHIAGSTLIPLGTCNADSIPHDTDKKLVFQCKAGVRGGKACNACAQIAPEKTVYNLAGGVDAWVACGYPLEK